MTDEAQGQSHDDTPSPPASTRWSEDPIQDDEGLAPPYVPGRPAAGADASRAPDEPVDEPLDEPVQEPTPEPEPEAAASSADEVEDEPFPFDEPFGGADEPEPAVADAEDTGEDDFPFDQFDIEGDAAPETQVEADSGWSPAADVEWEPEPRGEQGAAAEDIPEAELVPLDAEPEPVLDAEPDTAFHAEPDAAVHAEGVGNVDAGAAEEVAVLLDRLARMLREEGAEAVRREMDSSDRLTALLSGLISGYLSGRS